MAPKTNNHIKHKFRNHIVSNDTEILILGTFHPDIANSADFFYGRPRNYFWKIPPICLGASDLKSVKLEEKKEFMEKYKVDFADIGYFGLMVPPFSVQMVPLLEILQY